MCNGFFRSVMPVKCAAVYYEMLSPPRTKDEIASTRIIDARVSRFRNSYRGPLDVPAARRAGA
jgi:hypothetical protein